MNDIPGLLKRAGEAVVAVFSAFGGFVLNAQPPEGVLKGFTIGFASTLSALVFLIISVFSQRFASDRYRSIFTALAVLMIIAAAVTGFRYQSMFSALTLDIPSVNKTEKIVIGTDLTQEAKDDLAETHEPLSQLLLDFGGKDSRERVWPRDSIRAATLRLNNGYIALAVSIAAAVFCIAEALFPTKPSSSSGSRQQR
jgi:hypothetical protein